MPTWPAAGAAPSRAGSARPAAAALSGGTIRSCAGSATSAGMRSARRVDRPPRHPPSPRCGRVRAIPAAQALLRHRGGQRHAVGQPVLERHEHARPLAGLVQVAGRRGIWPRRRRVAGANSACSVSTGSVPPAQQRAQLRRQRRHARGRPGRRHGNPTGSPAAPGRPPVRLAQRRRQRQQPAHAVAGEHDRARHRRHRRFQAAGDVVGQGEAALLPPGQPQSSSNGRTPPAARKRSIDRPRPGPGCRRG